MAAQQDLLNHNVLSNAGQLIRFLENQQPDSQNELAVSAFERLYSEAAQPKSVSGNACVRLCGLVEQASKSASPELRAWAFSHDVVIRLFNFYIEWNEYDHHRSMRLVLDLVAALLRKNPDPTAAACSRAALLDDLVSIVARHSMKPVAKSAIKTLEHLLGKHVFTLDDLRASYQGDARGRTPMEVWAVLIGDLFDWMCRHFVCPAAGKLIVTLYRMLRQGCGGADQIPSIDLWYSWLLAFVTKEPSLIERIKNYVFLPLFKIDRKEALLFLQKMNHDQPVSASEKLHVDTPALIQLAALETGKRVGLVEEPDLDPDGQAQTGGGSIVLQEEVLESVLGHPSHEVRSLAFSILIASPSTTKPYSPRALQLLQKHLGAFFADPDAKFRVDVAARARDMFKRIRGAIFVLKRSIPRARTKAAKDKKPDVTAEAPAPAMYKTNLIALPEEGLVQCLAYHEEFLKWYLEFLCEELVPTASYQRHIASVKALGHILRIEGEKSKTWETADDQTIFFDVFDGKWVRALFDLLMDPFDDVRDVTSTVLKYIFADTRYRRFSLRVAAEDSARDPATDLRELSRRANDLARRTARADHADGVARVNQLLYRFLATSAERIMLLSGMIGELERKIALAEADLGGAVLEAPVHGDFASLCGMWQVVAELPLDDADMHEIVGALQTRLLECCRRAWASVKYILCDDSPEGHLPSELEELEGLDTKGLISYSFRSIHESSNLMRIMVLAMRNKSREGAVTPSKDIYLGIGRLTFEQLSSLRHRGAFTNVSATFSACCQQSKHLEQAEGDEDVLLTWYQGAMDAIKSQVSTTRRSAGIPSLITGILSANTTNPSFESVMDTLMQIASTEAQVTEIDDTQLPQVHAYNCLKDIFKNSMLTSLGNKSEAYLPRCLELAARGLRSEVWAVRNCGLIFLRSLIDCLFGSHESKQMIEAGWDGKANRIPYHRYPNLPEVLRDLLKSGHCVMATTSPLSAAAAESVFPALDIIRRAGPPELLHDEIQGDVAHYLSSSVWHVREMAARTLCSCLLHDQWLGTIRQIYSQAQSASGGMRVNYIHGVFLTLKFVFERLSEVSLDQLKADLPELVDFLSSCNIAADYTNCPDVVAAYLKVLNQTWDLQLAEGLPLQPNTPELSEKLSLALFKSQKVINDVFIAHQSSEPINALHVIVFNPHTGVNTLVTALETIPKLWKPVSAPEQTLLSLCSLYADAALRTTYLEAQTAAVENLADVLGVLLKAGAETSKLPLDELASFWACLPLGPMNPALSNAAIRAGGGIIAALQVAGRLTPEGLNSWAVLMADAGLADKVFDTRFAAAEAFCSFFTVVGPRCEEPAFLPVLLALYDTLNDDDEAVRDLGSTAFACVAGVSLVPVEAAERLLQWLVAKFGSLPAFRAAVAGRVIGSSESIIVAPPAAAGHQLAVALQVDDALFAVEEQNLFVDEVREAKRWTAVFGSLPWEAAGADGVVLAALDGWVCGGVGQVTEVVRDLEDGPLGWVSDAQVFAVATRIVHGYLALAKSGVASEELRAEAAALKQAALSKENVVSRLLMDALN